MKQVRFVAVFLSVCVLVACGVGKTFEGVESEVGQTPQTEVPDASVEVTPPPPPPPPSESVPPGEAAEADHEQNARKARAEREQITAAEAAARKARERAESEARRRAEAEAAAEREAALNVDNEDISVYFGDRPDGFTDEEWAEIVAGLDEIAPAAGGALVGTDCQAEMAGQSELILTCLDNDIQQYRQAKVPVAGDIATTLLRLQRQLAGPGFELGVVDATLCYWGDRISFTGAEIVNACLEWDERLSEAATTPPPVDDGRFDQGRVVHHAPSEMVLSQRYFLEIAIQPLTASTTLEAADANLREAVGTGHAPATEDEALDLEFTTIRASELMTASLVGSGFEITPISAQVQPLFPGEATVWQWEVVASESGDLGLTFSIGSLLTVAGREVVRTVKTLPLSVKVRSIDTLLADVPPEGFANAEIGPVNASGLADAASFADAPQPIAPSAAGCETIVGSNPDRHALLMTNLAYTAPISRLSQTHRDGEKLTEALVDTGFSVTHCRDLGQREAIRALSKLGRHAKARSDTGAQAVTFFYYSGHGANVDGTNYILPVDLYGADPTEIRDGGVTFEDIFNRVSSAVAATSFVVFDACRTVMDDQSRGIVSTYRPVGWPSGVFQAFATSPGEVAADSGIYSSTLSGLMTQLADPANVLFKRVQDEVTQSTGARQRPVYTDGTTGGDFYFKASRAQ